MKKIDTEFDSILKVNYDLCKSTLNDFKELVKSWYDFDVTKLDNRIDYRIDENVVLSNKKSGILSNYIYVYKEDDKYYIIDGFNRVLTDYALLEENPTIYIKVITDKLEEHELMWIMFNLNMWKLYGRRDEYHITDFFDRGFKLVLLSKFGIDLYKNDNKSYIDRKYNKDDIYVLDYYFRNERESVDYFKFDLFDLSKLFSNKQIVNDLKQIVKINKYKDELFNNYDMFINGFIMFLARKRVSGDSGEYDFNYFLNKLYDDKKFYKKLITMSGSDSTRKNIFNFFEKY